MNSIERRIEQAERAIGIEGQPVVVPGIIYSLHQGSDEAIPHFPEPVSEWVTVRRARDEAMQAELPYIVEANPFTEYEARHGLEPGMLAKHQLCGKVPFADLLATATGRTPEEGEQPRTRD
jgi:hypothetical protein